MNPSPTGVIFLARHLYSENSSIAWACLLLERKVVHLASAFLLLLEGSWYCQNHKLQCDEAKRVHQQLGDSRLLKPSWFLLRGGRELYELMDGEGLAGSLERKLHVLHLTYTVYSSCASRLKWQSQELSGIAVKEKSQHAAHAERKRSQRACRRGEGWGEGQTDQHLA